MTTICLYLKNRLLIDCREFHCLNSTLKCPDEGELSRFQCRRDFGVLTVGTFSGFGTERARLGTFRGFLIFFFKTSKFDSKSPLVIVKSGVDFRKTVLPAVILNFFFWTPNFTKLLNP